MPIMPTCTPRWNRRAASPDELIELIRASVIGDDEAVAGPFGVRRVTYADYTASGRALTFIEDYLRDAVLPRLLDGTALCAIGYTEPGAGSDLAAIATQARRVDGGWELRGVKRHCTLADVASWTGVAGLSFLIVMLCASAVEWVRLRRARDVRTAIPVAALALVLLAVPQFPTTDAGTMRVAAVQGNGPAGYFDERSRNFLADPGNYFWLSAMPGRYKGDADLYAWKVDGKYVLDDAILRDLRFGFRTTYRKSKREVAVYAGDQTSVGWKSIAEPWFVRQTSTPGQLPSATDDQSWQTRGNFAYLSDPRYAAAAPVEAGQRADPRW